MIASFSYYMLNIFVPPSAASKYSMLLIYPFTAFSFFFFLGGTKSFKFILICLFFNSILLIEGISATILSLIGLLFPKLHIVSVFIGLDGNPFSISLLCIFEIITYMKQMQEKGDQLYFIIVCSQPRHSRNIFLWKLFSPICLFSLIFLWCYAFFLLSVSLSLRVIIRKNRLS